MDDRALPSAVLWDMDGTLIDTEPNWIGAEIALIERYGGTWTHEQGLGLVGWGLLDAAAVLQQQGLPLTLPEIVESLSTAVVAAVRDAPDWRPGAIELLRELRAAGVPTALVTMSYRRTAEEIIGILPFEAFDVLICGDDVERPKPDPQPYLLAAAALGVDIRDAIAIEDSPTGIRSASAAGAVAIGVPHVVPMPQGDWTVWPTLRGRGLDDLRALVLEQQRGSGV